MPDALLSAVADELDAWAGAPGTAGKIVGVLRFYHDPVGFANTCINWPAGKSLTPYQSEVLAAIPEKKRVSVRGPHGLGKTGVTAIAILWFALTRDAAKRDWKCVTTAGAWRQLIQFLWPEIRKWAALINWEEVGRPELDQRSELLTLNIKLRHGAAFAVASDNPVLIEGAHADSILYVFDESKAVKAETFDAAEGAFSGAGEGSDNEAYAIAMSTPGEPNGRFYDIHRKAPGLEDWWARHVTKEEAIAAKRITRQWAEQRRKLWGDSAVYHNKVEGNFHSSDEDGVIPLAWVEMANERWWAWKNNGAVVDRDGRQVLGVDVARTGEDKTVMAIRHGDVVTELRETSKEDTMQTTGRAKGILEANPGMMSVVDVIGIGAGVVDRLREQGHTVEAFNASEGTRRKDATGELGFVNCLTGDARPVPLGSLLRIYRSPYQGPLFNVETASGDKFTATPNHQVLTRRGWVPVQALNVGDQLCNPSSRDSTGRTAVRPEVDDMPPTLGEVYGAAYRLFGSERVQAGAVDFHGDRPTGEINVVTVDRQLLRVHPYSRQHRKDLDLLGTLLGSSRFSRQRPLPHPLNVRHRDARVGPVLPDHRMSSRADLALCQRQSVQGQIVRFPDAACSDTLILQDPVNDALAASVVGGQGMDRVSGNVLADDLSFVQMNRAGQAPCLDRRTQLNAPLVEDAAYNTAVNAEEFAEGMDRFASRVALDQVVVVDMPHDRQADSFTTSTWLDAVFVQDLMDGGPVSPETVAERCQSFAADIPTDEVIGIKLASATWGHAEPSYVYTLETETGAYVTRSVVHRNCRSAAWWGLREMLDPSRDPTFAIPPSDSLMGDLTAPHFRATSGGKIQVESKDDIHKRIGRSTDHGDAVVQSAWPHEMDWVKEYGVVNCEKCARPFLAELHPERCPHCYTTYGVPVPVAA